MQQLLLGYLLDVLRGALVPGAALGQYLAIKSVEQLGGAGTDLAQADDAHRLALEFPAHQAVLGAAGPAAVLHLP